MKKAATLRGGKKGNGPMEAGFSWHCVPGYTEIEPLSDFRGIPLMMSTKMSDFFTPSPLSAFGNDLY